MFAVRSIEISGDRFTFDVDTEEQDDEFLGMGANILVNYELIAPGKIIESNADVVRGNTARWDFKFGESRNLRLVSKTSDGFGDLPLQQILLVILALGAIGVLVGAVLMARRKAGTNGGAS